MTSVKFILNNTPEYIECEIDKAITLFGFI
jgi:hypothetical protein